MVPTLFKGRSPLITDLTKIDSKEEMLREFERILPYFLKNQREILYLQEYYRGNHTAILNRVKKIREAIDNKVVVNYAWSATRDIVGYFLGKPVQYVHRRSDDGALASITELNFILDSENKNLINVKIAEDASICGTGYLGIFKDSFKKNGSSVKLSRLDPAYTGVIVSSNPEVDEVYSFHYYTEQSDVNRGREERTYYTVWTAKAKYTIIGGDPFNFSASTAEITESAFSYGGYLPIHEYVNNSFRMGDWEPALPLMDAIDFSASDRSNDIQQTVQAILVALGVDLKGDGVLDQLADNGILNVPCVAEGEHDPVIDYIGTPLDPTIGGTFSEYLEACMNVVIGVPDRKSRSGGGGDTGDAVFMRDGWMDIDLVASFKEGFFVEADRSAMAAILYVLITNNDLPRLDIKDLEIKFSRNKTSNLVSKVQALATALAAGVHEQDALEWADLTTDIQSVIMRMNEKKRRNEQEMLDFAAKQQQISGDTNNQPNNSKSSTEDKPKTNEGNDQKTT